MTGEWLLTPRWSPVKVGVHRGGGLPKNVALFLRQFIQSKTEDAGREQRPTRKVV